MRIMSFNVNGIRARMHQITAFLERFQPDVVGLQETKIHDSQFPVDVFTTAGYHVAFHGQKGHYGVAIASKMEPVAIHKGFPTDSEDAQRRLISATYRLSSGHDLTVVNGYFPQGESRTHPVKFPAKRKFYEDLQTLVTGSFSPTDLLVIMGDVNIAPEDKDIGIGENNMKRWLRTGKTSFLPEEREWLGTLTDWGLHDSYRHKNPEERNRFSWFDYRTRAFEGEPKRGLRIDLILATEPLLAACSDAQIDYDFRAMEKPSDHCIIWADFDI